MFGISWDQISGLVQRILMFAGGLAVGKGWISQELMIQLVGAAMSIAGILWGIKVNTPTSLVQSAAAIPDVKKIELINTAEGRKIDQATPGKVVVAK